MRLTENARLQKRVLILKDLWHGNLPKRLFLDSLLGDSAIREEVIHNRWIRGKEALQENMIIEMSQMVHNVRLRLENSYLSYCFLRHFDLNFLIDKDQQCVSKRDFTLWFGFK